MKRAAFAWLACIGAAAGAWAADDCGTALKATQPLIAEAQGVRIAFVPRPTPVPVGRHFNLDFAVCPDGTAVPDAARIQVDADMPAHRHGMNYRSTVAALSPGVYRAQGLMFHMPGRWRVIFDVPLEGRVLRLTHELEVQ